MRKLLIIVLVLNLVYLMANPAPAAMTRKGPKPYTYDDVTIRFGYPAQGDTHSAGWVWLVTARELYMSDCTEPVLTQGHDAYVLEVPASYRHIQAAVTTTGTAATDAAVPVDMDMYFYDDYCVSMGVSEGPGTDAFGQFGPGTRWILIHNFMGGPTTASVTLTPCPPKPKPCQTFRRPPTTGS